LQCPETLKIQNLYLHLNLYIIILKLNNIIE